MSISILTPKFPATAAVSGYMSEIEISRWGSNFGKLVRTLESRLSDYFDGAEVVTVSNCTAGLELVYRARMNFRDRWIALPSLTFVATCLAAYTAGREILFVDVDKDTWLSPHVSAWGVPVDGDVIDAAAAIGEQRVRKGQTAVFSFHATKIIGAGEGGAIVTHDKAEANEYRKMSNFGIDPDGISRSWGTNAKMSEYNAAVGLAALDCFDREPYLQLFDWYEKYLPANVVQQRRPRGVYPIMSVKCSVSSDLVAIELAKAGIATKKWYCLPVMHKHHLFNRGQKLPVTDDLEKHMLGLPWHLWLSERDVIEVCDKLAMAIDRVENH